VKPYHVLLAALGIAVGVGAVMALREATLSTHHHIPSDSRSTILLDAETKGGEPGQTLDEMVGAILLSCRLEVGRSDVSELRHEGDGRYRAVLRPGMDQTNARQLRGCLEDWTVDHVRIDVVELRPT
jgi:hypothetical protein